MAPRALIKTSMALRDRVFSLQEDFLSPPFCAAIGGASASYRTSTKRPCLPELHYRHRLGLGTVVRPSPYSQMILIVG